MFSIRTKMYFGGSAGCKLATVVAILGFILGCGGSVPTSGGGGGAGGSGFQAASTQQWIQQFGLGNLKPPTNGSSPSPNILVGVVVDLRGNAIVGAYTYGSYPGFSNSPFGQSDAYVIAKYSPTGKQLWLQEIGTADQNYLSGITVDAQGNIYGTGTTFGAFPGYSNPSATQQGVVFKLDPNGNLLWLQQLTNASEANPQSIAADSSGNPIIGFQSYKYSSSGSQPAGFLLVKIDQVTGQTITQQPLPSDNFTLQRIAVDATGNVLVIGEGGLAGFTKSNPGAPLVVKVDKLTGNILWGQSLASYEAAAPLTLFGIAADSSGDVLVGGAVASSNAGISAGYLPAPGATCILAKLDGSTGNALWVKQFGTGTGDEIFSVAVDADNNVLASGTTNGVFVSPYVQPNDLDFVMKFTPDGKNTWVQQFGNGLIVNSETVGGPQVAVDSQGNAYMGGLTQGAFSGFSNPNNATEMFLAKFGP